MLRLKSEIWAQAYVRQCYTQGVPAVVVYKGDPDAGAIYIKVNRLDGVVWLFGPAPQGLDEAEFERLWCLWGDSEGCLEADADQYIVRQRNMDRDLWVIELEDREGRHFLGEAVVEIK